MGRPAHVIDAGHSPLARVTPQAGPVVATAIHAGHDLSDAAAREMIVVEDTRSREEDPHTEALLPAWATRIEVTRSRFEVDLNRPRERCVYVDPEDAWGIEVWREGADASVFEGSRAAHDVFYAALRDLLDAKAALGPFVLLDVHSYNHRRGGPHAPVEDPSANPEVNLGTGSLDPGTWGSLAKAFLDGMRSEGLDAEENARFTGGHLSQWVNATYGPKGCALAVEFKKTFMDEWTGAIDDEAFARLRDATDSVARALALRLGAAAP